MIYHSILVKIIQRKSLLWLGLTGSIFTSDVESVRERPDEGLGGEVQPCHHLVVALVNIDPPQLSWIQRYNGTMTQLYNITIKRELVLSLFADITEVGFSLVKSRQATVATSLVLQVQMVGVAGLPVCILILTF